MELPFKIIAASEADTSKVAHDFSASLKPGDTVILNGDLGAGKTFFVKQICEGSGVENVSSPSFALVNEYQNGNRFIHFDFYRIKKIDELYDIGFEDYIMDRDAVVFIEWAELFPEILPPRYYCVEIRFINNISREISIYKK
jgi:tRNA threonylcarbamoyladenosine biosynthesis protein TsaE